MEITKVIAELLASLPHTNASRVEDKAQPIVWVEQDGEDGWTMSLYPGDQLDPEDRAWLWQQFADCVDDTVGKLGIEVKITPPHTFPSGKSVQGLVQYTYPPPDSGLASRHWWQVMSSHLPTINELLARRIDRNWYQHVADKLAKGRRTDPESRKARQLAAIQAAKHRQRPGPRTPSAQ